MVVKIDNDYLKSLLKNLFKKYFQFLDLIILKLN